MSHPEELLAEYVDGTLAEPERAAVDAHLALCDRCRGEISLTRGVRARLLALPELEAPHGSASEALRQAGVGGGAERGRTRDAAAARPPRWARWVPAAAAAVVVGLLAIALPRLSNEASSPSRNPFAAAGGVEATGLPAASSVPAPSSAADAQRRLNQALIGGVRLEHRDRNFAAADIQQLTQDTATRFLGASIPRAASSDAQFGAVLETSDLRAAFTCVSTQVTLAPTDALVEMIEARYEGSPAYVAVFLESPKPGARADEVVVWVVRTDDCSIVNFAYRAL